LQYDDIFSIWQRNTLPSLALYKYVGRNPFDNSKRMSSHIASLAHLAKTFVSNVLRQKSTPGIQTHPRITLQVKGMQGVSFPGEKPDKTFFYIYSECTAIR
jgi:hypothetical protein